MTDNARIVAIVVERVLDIRARIDANDESVFSDPQFTAKGQSATKERIAPLDCFEGYTWRAINDEVVTYRRPELIALCNELGVAVPLQADNAVLLNLALTDLRRRY